MDRRLRATFSRAVLLQWLMLEASAEVLIITYMMTSSSSAYAYSSFHDNDDGNDNKKFFFHPRQAQEYTRR
jgi:hypothetical protein